LFAKTLRIGLSAWDSANVPTRPAVTGAVGQERRRPPIVTRLVTLALAAAAGLVVLTATGHSQGAPRARVAANTTPSVVLPNGQPTLVQIVNAQREGDAILLRVDPVGAGGPRNLVVSPGAHVTGQSLEALLADAADRGSAMHHSRYRLGYDATGAIIAIAPH
jgi:hypothetical protein